MKKNSSISKRLKALRRDVKEIKKTVVTKKGVRATHRDLDGKFRRLALEIVNNSQNIRELKSLEPALSEVRENVWHIIDRLDAFARRMDGFEKKATAVEKP